METDTKHWTDVCEYEIYDYCYEARICVLCVSLSVCASLRMTNPFISEKILMYIKRQYILFIVLLKGMWSRMDMPSRLRLLCNNRLFIFYAFRRTVPRTATTKYVKNRRKFFQTTDNLTYRLQSTTYYPWIDLWFLGQSRLFFRKGWRSWESKMYTNTRTAEPFEKSEHHDPWVIVDDEVKKVFDISSPEWTSWQMTSSNYKEKTVWHFFIAISFWFR